MLIKHEKSVQQWTDSSDSSSQIVHTRHLITKTLEANVSVTELCSLLDLIALYL